MIRWRLLGAAAAGAFVLSAAGCGFFDQQYIEGELKDIMSGAIPSPDDRYMVKRPTVPILRKNIGIVRQDNLFVMIVGPGLKALYKEFPGDDVQFGVHIRRSPRRHLVVERVFEGGKKIRDLDLDGFRYRMPDLVDASEVDFDKFEQGTNLCEVPATDGATIEKLVRKDLHVSNFMVRRSELPDAIRDTELVAKSGRAPDRPQYFLTSDSADYLVIGEDPTIFLMLDYLAQEKREFEGGVCVRGVFDQADRAETQIAGTAAVHWLRVGGALYFRSEG